MASFHVRSKFAGSNADFAPCMEGSHEDVAPHMDQRHSFMDLKYLKLLFLKKIK